MKGMSASEIASLASGISGKGINAYYEQLIIVSHNKILDMNFLGLDLAKIPDFSKIFNGNNRTEYLALLILPILATVTIYFSSKINMKNMSEMGQTESSGKVMMYLPIVMTALFSFKVPAGLAIYWIVDNLFRIGQQIYINKCVMVDD
jgi:YidC/Oxa1 family membrane protein insertase